jgi:nitroreductase
LAVTLSASRNAGVDATVDKFHPVEMRRHPVHRERHNPTVPLPRGHVDEIGLFEAMYTQRAIRRFKPDPVPRELLERVVEGATKAPSGANIQPWAFVVVEDADLRSQLADLARHNFDRAYAGALARQQPGDPAPMPNLKAMIEAVDDIPVWVVICLVPPPHVEVGVDLYASIFPAVQNLLLSARGVGLGAVMTTLLGGVELPNLKRILNIPAGVEPVAFIPLGYPAEGSHYGPTTRRPLSEVVHWGSWDPDKLNSARLAYRPGSA